MGLVVPLVQEARLELLERVEPLGRVELLALRAAVVLLGAVVPRVVAAHRGVPARLREQPVMAEVLVWLVVEPRGQTQVVPQGSQPVGQVVNQRQGPREAERIRKADRAEQQERHRHQLLPLRLLKMAAVDAV